MNTKVNIIFCHRDFTSFASGDLFVNNANSNNVVVNVSLFKASSLADSSIQSISCNSTKTAIVQTISGEVNTRLSPITCVDRSHTFNWTFSKCGSYLSSIASNSVGSNHTITMSLCQTECGQTVSADGITLLVVDFVQKKPAPSIQSLTFHTSKSEIVTEVVMSAPGYVYCSVFPLSYVPVSVDLVVMGGNVASSLEENVTLVITIPNLQASSSFSLYCATYSIQGVKMSYDAMIKTKKTVSTSCCKHVIAQLLLNSFTNGTSEQNALRLSLDAPLSTDVTIFLDLESFPSSSLNPDKTIAKASFFPEKVLFKAGFMRSVVVAFRAHTAGNYQLNFTLEGNSAVPEVDVLYLGGQSKLSVVQANEKLSPPQFLSAEFSETGASVTVKFTAPTNKAQLPSSFACHRLLTFRGKNTC